MLADLLDDNAALHQVYAMLASRDGWEGNARRAIEHVRTVQQRTAHPEIREGCESLVAALSGLESLPDPNSREILETSLQQARSAMEHPATSSCERDRLLVVQQLLRHRLLGLPPSPGPGIPPIVHLVRTDSGADDLPLIQYLCYRSVLAHCSGYRVMLHTPSVPRGERWERLLPHLELHVAAPPQWLGERRLVAAAHQSDAWRVKQLLEHGGFYFDWDLLLLRSPDCLRELVCVMALERKEKDYHEVLGVSAIGAEPGSAFLQAWLDAMPSAFNPNRYVAHSIVLAHHLAVKHPSLVRVLDYRAFYDPGWSAEAMAWLFDPARCLPEDELRERLAASIGMHLFCSHANFVDRARSLTERDIEKPRCNLARLMRPHL